jgi:tetratricopeptide (TPR) repeat protein
VRPIFYRVQGHDHSGLAAILDELDIDAPAPGAAAGPSPRQKPEKTLIPQLHIHRTTEDRHYVGRGEELRRLDEFATSSEVRVVAVTGVGGAGKTSLLGHWLSQTQALAERAVKGVFVWSFYENQSFAELTASLIQFARDVLGWNPGDRETEAGRASLQLLKLLQELPLCILLDGLEVVQGDHLSDRYGVFLDQNLAELLGGLARRQHGLTLLTSRFPFADLNRFRGLGFAEMQLPRMSPDEGADLLTHLEVAADREVLMAASEALQGHALALRVLGASARRQAGRLPDITRFPDLLGTDEFSQKMNRLLSFYAQKISASERQLAGLVSLFPNAVPKKVLSTLARQQAYPGLATDQGLEQALTALESDGLLLREPGTEAWFAHPVVRDYFRPQGGGLAEQAANLIAGRPLGSRPTSIEDLHGVLDAICILCEAGIFSAAWSLYASRCGTGEVFYRLGAPRQRHEVESRFVTPEAERQLGHPQFAKVLNNAASGRARLGDLPGAVEMHDRAIHKDASVGRFAAAARGCGSKSSILAEFRPASDALAAADQGYLYAERTDDSAAIINAAARKGRRLAECGRATESVAFISRAYWEARRDPVQFRWAGNPFRFDCAHAAWCLQRPDLAAAIFEEDAEISGQNDYARYAHWARALAAAARGEHRQCLENSRALFEVARASGDVLGMAQHLTLVAKALTLLGDSTGGDDEAQRAVELAAHGT